MFYRMVGACKISVAALFNMLTTNKSCGNIRCFDQKYQSSKITL